VWLPVFEQQDPIPDLAMAEYVMRASHVDDSLHLRERAMRASSKELKDNNTAAVIMRLADLYNRLADRAETLGNRVSPRETKPKRADPPISS